MVTEYSIKAGSFRICPQLFKLSVQVQLKNIVLCVLYLLNRCYDVGLFNKLKIILYECILICTNLQLTTNLQLIVDS